MEPIPPSIAGHAPIAEPQSPSGVREILQAIWALASERRNHSAPRPGTPLRALALVALDTVVRNRGSVMPQLTRGAVIELMELGALMNDRFDGEPHDRDRLSRKVAWFAGSKHRSIARSYAKRVRNLERHRPRTSGSLTEITHYRENVNRVSLAALWALASPQSLEQSEAEILNHPDLELLFQIIMLTQVIDDVWDFRRDLERRNPSFATAAQASRATLRCLVRHYLIPPTNPRRGSGCLRLARWTVAASALTVIAICFPAGGKAHPSQDP
jgi:hypothetical protein